MPGFGFPRYIPDHFGYVSQLWYKPPAVQGQQNSVATLGRLRMYPWKIVYPGAWDRLAVRITVAAVGGLMKCAWYRINQDGSVSKIIECASDISTNTTGLVSVQFPTDPQLFGWVAPAFIFGVAAPTIECVGIYNYSGGSNLASTVPDALSFAGGGVVQSMGLNTAYVSGAEFMPNSINAATLGYDIWDPCPVPFARRK